MDKLSAQDVGFLKIETPRCPFHVAALVILTPPDKVPANYLRQLARKCGRLNEILPAFNKRLQNPEDLSAAAWVTADDYQAENHVFHYRLPATGRMTDLMQLVTRAHERALD
ncbi:MAG: wax ester/triacylglycerol synthase family O-acyltransferase, partial [Haliea sp.]